jgi:hypothetical protein
MAVFNHSAPGVVKRAGFVDDIMAVSFAIRQSAQAMLGHCAAYPPCPRALAATMNAAFATCDPAPDWLGRRMYVPAILPSASTTYVCVPCATQKADKYAKCVLTSVRKGRQNRLALSRVLLGVFSRCRRRRAGSNCDRRVFIGPAMIYICSEGF